MMWWFVAEQLAFAAGSRDFTACEKAERRLANLGAALAAAGALTFAWKRGHEAGHRDCGGWASTNWRPNTDGVAAPGWGDAK